MQFLATCISWVESITRKELERLGINITHGQDRLVEFEWDMKTLAEANIWLRTANRVYIQLEKISITSLESLFAVVENIHWNDWIPFGTPINISATTIRSAVTHTPSMQSVGKKAIIRSLRGNDGKWNEVEGNQPIEILLLLVADELRVLINTSGDALHKRGYREQAGEAPLKESLAAALVLFSSWKFWTPLYDPLCGSGTILIEAAMIARNIAPWLNREFDALYFPWYDLDIHEMVKKEARAKKFDKSYQIFGSDISSDMVEIACANARNAGVIDTIRFSENLVDEVKIPEGAHIVTNPPYGKRMGWEELWDLYDNLERLFVEQKLTGGVITTFEDFPKDQTGWSKKNLMNGVEKCQFWRKMA